MRKKCFIILIALLLGIPSYSQEKGPGSKEGKAEKKDTAENKKITIGDQVYYEMVVEDFEKTEYNNKNINYPTRSQEEKAAITIREDYPAPIKNSKKYLGVKLYGKSGNVLQIIPPKKLIIDKFCRSISFWIFGKSIAGELSMLIKDGMDKSHRLIIGKLKFIGWRKIIIKIPTSVIQEHTILTKKKQIEILKLIYTPGSVTAKKGREATWHYFYIDDINAMVREKYTDRQSDDW